MALFTFGNILSIPGQSQNFSHRSEALDLDLDFEFSDCDEGIEGLEHYNNPPSEL